MVPCDNLEEWDREEAGVRLKREGICVYLRLIHLVIWQNPKKHCKAIIIQLKIYFLKKVSLFFCIFSLFSSWITLLKDLWSISASGGTLVQG